MKFSTLDNLRTLDTIEAYSFLKIDFQVQKTFLVKAVIIRGKLTFLVDPFKSSVTVAIRAHYHPLKRPTDGQKGSLGEFLIPVHWRDVSLRGVKGPFK